MTKLREDAQVKTTDLAKMKIMSRDKLWRIENGQSPVKAGDIVALCWAYKVDASTTNELAEASLKTLEKTIYEKCRDVMPSWFGMYVELEAFANVISNYESELVPGLVQTADYARAIFESGRPIIPTARIDRLVSTRIERARSVLDGPVNPQLNIVLNEAVFARPVGGTTVMAAQVAHLRAVNAKDQVNVRVLPLASGAHAAMEGAFTLLRFAPETGEPELAYQENRAGSLYIEPPGR